jgi:c-di-GMP-binding flagellar brake protein YcgR
MDFTNRRSEERVSVRIPIRFRPLTDPPSAEQSAESVNISQHGLLFSTSYPLRVGEKVEIFLRMPRELSQNLVQVRWKARVVHVRNDALPGKTAVGVSVERHEPLVARETWVC